MNRNFFRGLVVSLFGFAMGVAAYGQEPDRLVVNIPYDFVVNGKTLPAGKYDVKRSSESDLRILSISSAENHASVVALTTDVNHAREFHPAITLHRIGDQNVLTKIQTAEHIFTIPASEASSGAATAKAGQNGYLTGTSESNKR